jgi:hypothetical protein
MESQIQLYLVLLREVGERCGTSTSKDEETILRRVAEEGFSYLTITLPSFEKGLLACLEQGHFDSKLFEGFALGKLGIPKLFQGFLSRIFDDNGDVRSERPDVVARHIQAVRQLCCFYAKYEAPTTEARRQAALAAYETTDAQLAKNIFEYPADFAELDGILNTFNTFLGDYIREVNSALYHKGVKPKHGPGAVAEKLTYNGKYSSCTWTDRLEAYFPAFDTLCVNAGDWLSSSVSYLGRDQEPPVRVVTVPKTARAPRIIAIEPTWMQFVQQGIFGLMTDVLSKKKFRPLQDSFGWNSQIPNQEMARIGSTGGFATIDLSEASDRVSLALVEHLFSRFPFLLGAMKACRSERATLPDNGPDNTIRLRKFASMGSALCFPVETLVFTTIVLYSMTQVYGTPSTIAERDVFWRLFRVFGDDMVVPEEIVPSLIGNLEAFGLKVNTQKSFWNGKFRESCGEDWYYGMTVNYVKSRHPLPERRQHGLRVLQAVALHNHLFVEGYYKTAAHIESILVSMGLGVYAPVGTYCYAMYTWHEDKVKYRTSPTLQKLEVQAIKARSVFRVDPLSGYGALRKYFLNIDSREPLQEGHLERAGRPLRVTITKGWADPTVKPEESRVLPWV